MLLSPIYSANIFGSTHILGSPRRFPRKDFHGEKSIQIFHFKCIEQTLRTEMENTIINILLFMALYYLNSYVVVTKGVSKVPQTEGHLSKTELRDVKNILAKFLSV